MHAPIPRQVGVNEDIHVWYRQSQDAARLQDAEELLETLSSVLFP
jgi:hypothetical protein